MADFQFYLNRQGVRGAKGVKGDKGDSPIVSVNKHTANEYVLQIDNPDGTQIITPNLVGQQIVVNTAGDYVKYDRNSNQFVTVELPSSTGEEEGLIRLATDADYVERDEFSAVTPYGLVKDLPSLITTSVDNLIRVFYDEPTDSIVLDTSKISEDISSINDSISNLVGKTNPATTTTAGIVKPDGRTITVRADGTISAVGGGGGGGGDVTAAGDNRFTGDNTFTGKVNISGAALTVEGLATLNQVTAQYLNAVSITSAGEINATSIKANGLRSDDIQTTENKKYLTEADVDNQTIQIVNGKLHANLDELGNEVNSLTGEVNSLTGDVTDLTGRVTVNETDISAMKTGKQNKLTAGSNVILTDLSDGTVRIDSTGGGGTGDIPIATTTTAGKVKPDGRTITVTEDGTITAAGGSAPDNMVTTDTTQTISGSKTFSSTILGDELSTTGSVYIGTEYNDRYSNGLTLQVDGVYFHGEGSTAGYLSNFNRDMTLQSEGKLTLSALGSDTMVDIRTYRTDVLNSVKVTNSTGTYDVFTSGNIVAGDGITISEPSSSGIRTISANGGSTGTTDYTQLENKPQINSVELTGNKTLDDLGIQAKGNYLTALPDNAVTTDTTQEITGDKTFTGSITTANITCNNTLMASTIRTKANGTIKLSHPMDSASGIITLDNNYGQLSITNGLSSNNNLLQVVSGTAYATLMGNKIETKDKDGNLYHYINSQNITNCLLEVPQRIKLELNDGTLTLKAGSRVIVPNGFGEDGVTPKFDEVVVENDLAVTNTWGTAEKIAIFVSPNATSIYMIGLDCLSSGTTAPTTTDTRFWYDTNTNLVKTYSGGSYTGSNRSFPIAICTKTSTSNDNLLNSIDQVFNGMGYIGSTVWVDKGVKGLIPNGRNEDGSLNNTEVITTGVRTRTLGSNVSGDWYVALRPGITWTSVVSYRYDEEKNMNFSSTTNWIACIFGRIQFTNGVITSFQPKLPLNAVNYSNKPEISSWGMPSDRYINLSLGTSGSTYTAPVNGYAYLSRTATATGQYIALSSTIAIKTIATTKGQLLEVFIPVKRGNSFTADYTAETLGTFRFVYAEGEV